MQGATGSEGIVCLANDGIIDGLIALCESLSANSPNTALTVIPFDANLRQTRALLTQFGYDVYDDPSLQEMDALGARYWPGDAWRPHTMRKFCAFWGPYERFLFLDADIVVLQALDRYFAAFREHPADFMYFSTDLCVVYEEPLRDAMIARHGAVGFNTGAFMGRKRSVTPAAIEQAFMACGPDRPQFVDINEQTFVNYVVDVSGLSKADVHKVVPEVVDGWAGMRLKRRAGGFVLADARMTAESGRPVSLIHWAGYSLAPFMPYRSTFLTYRLARANRLQRLAYHASSVAAGLRRLSPRTPVRLAYRWRSLSRNWLQARGYSGWLPGWLA